MSASGKKWGKVATHRFQGTSALSLDGKGRVTVPARHRDLLNALCGQQLTLTKHHARCLAVFPRPDWEVFRDKLTGLPASAEPLRRLFIGSAVDVDIDAGSRILVPPELRQFAGLEKDVLLVGVGARLELWDAGRHAEQEQRLLAEGDFSVLQNLVG